MPASQLASAQHGIIAWSKNADGDTAGPVVQTAILVPRYMEPTGRGAASNIGQPIPTVGVPATTTLSKGHLRSIVFRSEDACARWLKASPLIGEQGYCYRAPKRPFWSARSSQALPPVCIRQVHSR